jgi:DNA-binding transcriptional MerR regulator
MPERIYHREEFLEKVGLSQDMLGTLMEAQVLRAAGKVDGESPYFDENGVETAIAIVKLLEIGYSVEDVVRIRRKVGLPKKRGERIQKGKPLLTVGELANRIGSNPRTIKHWEEKGIIEPDSYSPGGFRLYSEVYVQLCLLIQDLQLFGYSLDQIKGMADLLRDFLTMKDQADSYPPAVFEKKLGKIRAQIEEISGKMQLFEKGIERWRGLLKQKHKEISLLAAKGEKAQRKRWKGAGTGKAPAKTKAQAPRDKKKEKASETTIEAC